MGWPRPLDVRVLGQLEVYRDNRMVAIAGAKPRAVLSLLGLYAGRVVSADVLLELLWGDDPPRTATKALQTHVSALRRSLGDGVVLTKGAGWLLAGASTDASRFEAAASAGRDATRMGDAASAVLAFSEALEGWRGPPDLPNTPRARSEVARWIEERDTLVEDRVDALLACGEAAELVGELESAVAEAPLRERRWSQLMLALYRAGRQADALGAYQRARRLLSDQLGVQPGPELRRLEAEILGHDPGLAAPERAARSAATLAEAPPVFLEATGVLPVQRTTFVGRHDELTRIDGLLRSAVADPLRGSHPHRHSLITIVGPGGVGKTRLAVTAAESAARLFRAGVVFVDLVPVRSMFVIQSVAAALGIAERPQQSLEVAIHDHLGQGRWMLVLDNCEHVLEPVSAFADGLGTACPGVVVLATSRERLGALGERVITAPPLALVAPGTGESKGSEAATLFLERARAVEPDFDPEPDLVGQVCARLDGIPLAIELAAVRCASLGVDGVLAGLDDRMRLLMGARGVTERHRSLRAVLDWSHDLLDDEEQATFRRVSVFAGGFDLDSATAVAAGDMDGTACTLTPSGLADLVGRLADKNLLVHRQKQGRSRWRLLEIVKVYARERLAASGEEALLRERHLRWAAATAERLEDRMAADQAWRDEFDAVADDLRAALSPPVRRDDVAHRLARALGHLAYARGFLAEARQHYREAAAHASGRAAVEALHVAAGVAFAEMRHNVAYELLLDAAERSAAAGEHAAQSIALASAVVLGARCPGGFPEPPSDARLGELLDQARAVADDSSLVAAHVAAARAWTANPARARCDGPLGEQALAAARRAQDPVLISAALDGVTTVALGEGRFRRAALLAGQRLELLDRLARHDPRAGGEIVDIFHMVTETALAAGDLPGALAAAQRARDDSLARGVPMLASSRLVLPFALCGAFDDVLGEATEMRDAWERAGRPPAGWMAPAVYATALVCGLTGDAGGFQTWSAWAREVTKDPRVQGFAPFVDGRVALNAGRISDAVATADALPAHYLGKFDAYARAIAAEIAVVAGLPDAAQRLGAAAAAGEENDWAAACLVRAEGRLRGDRDALERSVARWERIEARFERACTLLLIDARADEGLAELNALGCPLPVGAS